MSYLEESLSKGEKLNTVFRLHWIIWARIGVWGAASAFALFHGFRFAAGILLFAALGEWVKLNSIEQAVTNKRVIQKTGIVSRKTEEMKLSSIETVEIQQSFWGRIFGYGTVKVAIAVGVASVASFARVMRAETLRVRQATYVEAAYAVGTRWYVTLWRHVLPNAAGPVAVLAVLEFGLAILAVSALSFLGYGAPPPAPEWGSLVAEGRNYLAVAWWLCALPGLTIAATVLAVNRISRALDGEWRRFR